MSTKKQKLYYEKMHIKSNHWRNISFITLPDQVMMHLHVHILKQLCIIVDRSQFKK